MPLYEYRCECGAVLEALDKIGVVRERCGELCASSGPAAPPGQGQGKIERLYSSPGIRGDGKEAKEQTVNPVRRARRPGCDCE